MIKIFNTEVLLNGPNMQQEAPRPPQLPATGLIPPPSGPASSTPPPTRPPQPPPMPPPPPHPPAPLYRTYNVMSVAVQMSVLHTVILVLLHSFPVVYIVHLFYCYIQ